MAEKLGNATPAYWHRLGVKWYEVITAVTGSVILVAAFLAWWFGARSLQWAVDVTSSAALALGALSIILLWAQLRSTSRQERQQGIYKRIMCLHEHFHDVPRLHLAETVRVYLYRELAIHSPPSARNPLTRAHAEAINMDAGNQDRPPARVLVTRYLNDWEDFCGAIRSGVIDENYAMALEGARLVDAFFGYREAINIFRETRGQSTGKVGDGATAAPPIANKLYYELQRVALEWHRKRTEEWNVVERRMAAANEEADRLRDEAQSLTGVQPNAKVGPEQGRRSRH